MKKIIIGTKAFLTLSLATLSFAGNGQSITSATNTAGLLNAVYVCPACTSATAIECINVDMQHVKPDINLDDRVYGYVFTGGVGYDGASGGVLSDLARVYVKSTFGPNSIDVEIPTPITGFGWTNAQTPLNPTYVPHDADIALGHFFDRTLGKRRWFGTVVYEINGEIYMEAWEYDPYNMTAGYTSLIPTTTLSSGQITGGQVQISNASGAAKYPHIDLVCDQDDPTDLIESNFRYVVTWEEGNVVMNADGDLFNAPSAPVTIGNGNRPDIAGIANHQYSTSSSNYDDDMIYTTYIDANNGNLVLAERKWGNTSVLNTYILESSSNFDAFYPRIAGARYYDFSASNNSEPACVVVATVDDGSLGAYQVKSYTLYEAANNPGTVQDANVSDYGTNGRFTSVPSNCIMPVITGTGVYTKNKYAAAATSPLGPNPDFSTIFYSDYTWTSGAYNPSGNGDMYNSNIDMSTYLPTSSNYNEVTQVNFTSGYTLNGTRPMFGAASSNNSNYDIFVTFYDGTFIRTKLTNSNNYSFKSTSINSVANAEVSVYPNPVTTEFFLGDADGANYSITDITGKVMATGKVVGDKQAISTANYTAGTYILQVAKDGVPSSVKFMKQ